MSSINLDFNPKQFRYQYQLPIEHSFWIEVNGEEDVPASTDKRFYTPSNKAQRGWHEKLKLKYDIEEDIYYNPEIVGLARTVTPEMLERKDCG